MDFQSILKITYFGNTVQDYAIALIFLLSGWVFYGLISNLLVRLISQLFKRSEYKLTLPEYKFILHRPLNFFLSLVFILLAANSLKFPEQFNLVPGDQFGLKMVLWTIYKILMAISLTRVALKIIVIFGEILKKKADNTTSKQDDQLIPFAVEVAKILLIVISLIVVVGTVFNLNVGSLVAGLGIGGLAIALAAKESLENLFGSFTIFFDKPFMVGDLVKVGEVEGVVEKVGFRSTRIRTLDKSYLTIPNKKMIDAELDNLSLRTFRRVKFFIGLVYGTKLPVMKAIVEEIQKFLDDHPRTNQEAQVRFMEFGSSSLDIMVLYYIDTMDYALYLQYKEEINYRIMEIVEEKGSEFAYPTQTLFINKDKS